MSLGGQNDSEKKGGFLYALLGTFFGVSVVLVLCYLSLFLMGSAVIKSSAFVTERQKTTDVLDGILLTLREAEAGQRGYLLTGDREYREPYDQAINRINSKIDELNRIAAREFSARDLEELRRLIDTKLGEMRTSIEAFHSGGRDAAVDVVKTDQGFNSMQAIIAKVQSLRSFEEEQTQLAINRSSLLSNVRTILFGLGTLLSLFVIYRAYRRIAKDSDFRQKQSDALAEQRKLLEVTLASIGDAVIVTDTEAKITFLNRVAVTLTGWSPEDAVGKPCHQVFNIIAEGTRDPVASPVDKVLREGTIVGLANHTLLIRKDGSEVPIDDSGAPIRDQSGEIRGVVLVFRDFSDHKNTQNRLIEAKDEAERANKAKDSFLASLSHELRTPLTPIAATLAAWELSGVVPKDLQPQVQLMKRNVDLEARLIDDLLDLTRIVQGKLSLNSEVIDLHDLIVATTAMYQSDIHGKRLQLRLGLDAAKHHAYADPGRMQQVFWNILKNATKFTPAHGLIEITSVNLDDGRIAISFKDSGIGMTPETLEKLFQPFEQGADEQVRRAGGLGLGMAISLALVSAQDGKIEAHSGGQGKGSTFTVTMPIAQPLKPGELSSGPISLASRIGHGRRILLVEDHQDTADVMALLLRQTGHDVTVANNVSDAIKTLQTQPSFDILVSDVGLPDGTGVDLIKLVRAEFGPDLPAIALTGFGMEEDIARTQEAGFNEHLTKPVNSQRLEMAIQKLTAQKD